MLNTVLALHRIEGHTWCVCIEAVEVEGSQSPDDKSGRLKSFLSGESRILIFKPKICGFGLNFQCAGTMIFLGMNDSYEGYYQCIRRSWRYGQKADKVNAYVVTTQHEYEIVDNVRRKERETETLSRAIVEAAKKYEIAELQHVEKAEIMERKTFEGPNWQLIQGDCIESMAHMPDNSIDLSIFSPPFSSLYTYSASEHDLGNSKNHDEFFKHFGFVISNLIRVTKPGAIAWCISRRLRQHSPAME